MTKLKTSNGEVSMKKRTTMNLKSSGWLATVSRVLILTMLLSTFMHQGWFSPKPAQAVVIGTTTTMVRAGTGSTGPLTITNATWSCAAGTNRLLVIAVTGEGASGANFSIAATKGAGISFTDAIHTVTSRAGAYIGYLTEAQIVASGTNSIVITNTGTLTGLDANIACYSNVDQNNPIVATSIVQGETAATATGAFSVSALNQGMVVVAMADATAQVINSSTWAGRTDVYTAGTGYGTHGMYKAITATATETGTFTRTTSARYGIAAASLRPYPDFTIGDGTSMGSLSVGPSTVNNTLDRFTMQMAAGTGTITSLVVTGSANFTSTNIPTNGVKIWRDTGTVPGAWDSGDTLISTASTAIAGNATTVTISSESATTTAQNYIITVDINAGATLAQSFSGTITSAAGTGLGTTQADNDTSSSTLTVATPNLAIGNGTNPINKIAQRSSTNNAVDGFTIGTTATSANSTVTSLTVTGSANFTATNIPTNGVKVWRDTGTTVGYWDAGDTLISTGSTAISGNATTVTISSEAVTAPAKNYIVTVDITAGATLGQAFTVTVTGAAGSNLGTAAYSDSSSATLTVNKLPATIGSCGDCHAYPPNDGASRDGVNGAFVGDHQKHMDLTSVTCATCHIAPSTETSADFSHRDGNIQMQVTIAGGSYNGGAVIAQVNSPKTTNTCSNITCHGGNNPTPQWGVGSAGCVDCHAGTISRVVTSGTLSDVVAEFGLAWGHKKSGRGAITSADCIVCHLEGDYSTQGTSAKHMDGNIDLRDPDGAGETAITDMSGGVFTFTKFATSYAAGSRTATGHTSNNIDNVLTQKFCLACHDSNGATNPTARTPGGTQYMPWGGVNLGASYTVINGAAVAGGVVDVKTQTLTTNSSRHPIQGPNNRAYPYSTRLAVPYNNIGTTRDSNTAAGNTASPRVIANSVVLNCFDCHTTGTTLTTRTIAAHGNSTGLRGTYFAASPTLCTSCHIGNATTTAGYLTSSQHGNGSALATGNNNIGTNTTTCHNCHFSNQTAPGRPIQAADIHGFNGMLATGAAWAYGAANGMRPVAFIRNTGWSTTSPRPYIATGITAGQSTCGGNGTIGSCGSQNHSNYSPGGSY